MVRSREKNLVIKTSYDLRENIFMTSHRRTNGKRHANSFYVKAFVHNVFVPPLKCTVVSKKVTKMLYIAHHRQPFLREFKGNKNE